MKRQFDGYDAMDDTLLQDDFDQDADEDNAYDPAYDDGYYDGPSPDPLVEETPLEDEMDWRSQRRREKPRPTVISVSQITNLICLVSASAGLLGLFFCVAEQKNRAVRRTAVQSAGLFCVAAFGLVAVWVIGSLLGAVPLVGGVFGTLAWMVGLMLMGGNLFFRFKLMLHAYRGEAYVIPVIGQHARQFE